MRRPIVAKQSLDLQSNHFLRRSPGYPLGISLSELDYLRGWRDDFFGDSLHPQYSTVANLGGTGALQDPAHAGIYRLNSAAAVGSSFGLYLGGGYDTLDADRGWVQFVRCRIRATTDILAIFAAVLTAGAANFIQPCIDTGVNANWRFRIRTGGGAVTHVDSGVAADTDWHWHAIPAYPPSAGNRQVDHYLDGRLINSYAVTANIPGAVMEPFNHCQSLAVVTKQLDIDTWILIPRDL